MYISSHKYRVVGTYKEVYVTYKDFSSAEEFKRNASKRCGWLKIEANEGKKNDRA